MDGIHDMGGMEGFGAVMRDEEVFHAPWERRALGMALTASVRVNIDEFRHVVERLDPAIYLSSTYYGRWLAALEVRLVEHGAVTSDEVDARSRAGGGARPCAVTSGGHGGPPAGGGSGRIVDQRPRFAVGQDVRAADIHPHGHTRLPRYVRGRTGVVRHVHPAFVFPDTHAHGGGENPQYVYGVEFTARDLWGEGDHVVHVDIFESHLEPA